MSSEVKEDKNEVKEVVKDYAFINEDNPENKKIFFVTKGYPKILPIEYPEIKTFDVKENSIDKWEIYEDKVIATNEITEKIYKSPKGYAFINEEDLENKIIYFTCMKLPKIIPVEYPLPRLDPKLFNVKEKDIKEWELYDDRVVATYEISEKSLKEEKEKVFNFYNHIYTVVKNSGLAIDENNTKLFLDTKEENLELILEKLKNIKEDEEIEWEDDPIEWETVNKKKLILMKDKIIDHYERCDERLEELLELVEVCQTIYALDEINNLEDWPNTIVATYEDGSIKMFLMNELLDDERHLKYNKKTTD
jgi:hypothetical protein